MASSASGRVSGANASYANGRDVGASTADADAASCKWIGALSTQVVAITLTLTLTLAVAITFEGTASVPYPFPSVARSFPNTVHTELLHWLHKLREQRPGLQRLSDDAGQR